MAGKKRLDGRRALVTGATGGIGRAIAAAFVREGALVAVLGRRRAALKRLEMDVSVVADVSEPAAAERAVRRAHDLLGGLDAVVNAAGVDCEWKPTGELPVESWDETIATNLSGTFYVCRAALPLMVAGGGGTIVNLTSVAGHKVWAEDVAYGASKAGVTMLTKTIAVEYAAAGIRASCIAPGVIDAGMTDTVTTASDRDELVAMHPLGRMGRSEEVAEAAVWLCSEASSFTTGATLAVDGGFLA